MPGSGMYGAGGERNKDRASNRVRCFYLPGFLCTVDAAAFFRYNGNSGAPGMPDGVLSGSAPIIPKWPAGGCLRERSGQT
jgi:hypothetical protein